MKLPFLSFIACVTSTQIACDEKNKCHPKADCYQEKNKQGEYRPFCQCKPGYYGDGISCEEKFTLVIELCRGEDGKVIPGALRGAQNTSMLMNFWMTSEERGNYQQNLDYNLPDTKLGQSMTINYYDPMNIFHINKIKVLQDNWQNICLSRLSIHQGDAFIYILRTLDNRYYEPDWSDCSNPNDPEKCVVYTWWKKKCKGRKKANGEDVACRSRFLYKHDIEPNLYIVQKDECALGEHACHANAMCTDTTAGYQCTCKSGYEGNGKNCDDVNECDNGIHDCDNNATCMNTNGTFECNCNPNFSGDGKECIAKREAAEVCQRTPLPEFVNIVSSRARKTKNGIIFRVKCDDGRDIVPSHPGKINRLRGYKANCKCSGKTGECSWVMHPSFSCEKGCPHEHLAELREIRSWEDERPNHQGHFQLKLKAQFKPPAGEIDGWRLLIKFGMPIPDTAIIRTGNANVIYQSSSHRLMLLGNVDENQYLTAEDGAVGILFKIANLEEHEKINLLRNIKASYVGSDVNDITCFT